MVSLRDSGVCQPSTVLAKRGFPAEVGASPAALQLATAFPRPVWLDHLLPSLELSEAVTLRATCSAMRAIVADMRADLGYQGVKHLKAVLTCFPKADTVELREEVSSEEEQDSVIEWLKERGHSLTRVQRDFYVKPFHRRAWRAGVFDSIKNVDLQFDKKDDRDLIIDGVVSGVETIFFQLSDESPETDRATVGYLRTFTVLKDITCIMVSEDISLPPFIPPSLEALALTCDSITADGAVPLPGRVAAMITSSGAKLRRLELTLSKLADEGTARGVRSLLQACASTLKEVELIVDSSLTRPVEVLEGLASCQHLERLKAPLSTFAVAPPGNRVTFHIANLCLRRCPSNDRPLSSLALWGLMARGAFPILSSLRLDFGKWSWGADLGPAIVAAFGGVAGTLKELTLLETDPSGPADPAEADGVLQQVGEAIGKLRRLEILHLEVGGRGLRYHDVAQGVAK
jgi:hypothetical protein